MSILAVFSPLRNRTFALLWSGQTISQLGDNVYRVGFIWLVVALTRSATTTAITVVAFLLPNIVLLLFGGVIVDRFPRRAIMLLSDSLRGVFVLVLMLLMLTHQLMFWHLLTISILFGATDAFFQPAYTAIMPEIISAEGLVQANSLTAIGRQTALIVGPALGGIFVQAAGLPAVFGFDAFSFFVSACTLLLIPAADVPGTAKAKVGEEASSIFSEAREGLAYAVSTPWLWISLLIAALSNAALLGAIDVGLPFLVKGPMHQGAGALGLIYTLQGVGTLVGGLLAGQLHGLRRPGLTAYFFLLCMGIAVAAMGLFPFLLVIVPVSLLYGIGFQFFSIIWTSTIQKFVPSHLLGRISSVDYLVSYALMPVGAFVTGIAVSGIGPSTTFALAGFLIIASIAVGLTSPSVRRLGEEISTLPESKEA